VGFLSKLGAFTVAGSIVLFGGGAVASAEDVPPPTEETFDYPGAEAIFKSRGILLKKGDGHILLAECAPGGNQLEVRSRNRDPFCFNVKGKKGWLTLELTEAFLIFSTDSHKTEAKFTVDGVTGTKTVLPGEAEGIGEGGGSKSATLIELRVG
jgi:hypothetical protein